MTDIDRFWARVKKTPTCWLWTGGPSCQISWHGKAKAVHVVAWELECGPVPEGYKIIRTCGKRWCVRCLQMTSQVRPNRHYKGGPRF